MLRRVPPSGDDHLRCAATLAAADRLMKENRVAADPSVMEHGYLAAMKHMNAYAIPNRIREREAFAKANAERDRLLATLPPQEIMERARLCLETVPRT